MSSFNNAGLGDGPFSGGDAGGLKGGIHAAMKVINNHYKNMGVDSDKQNTQSIAAFERAVMKRLGR
jgi:hypothetical protein